MGKTTICVVAANAAAVVAIVALFMILGCRRAASPVCTTAGTITNSAGMEMVKLSSGYYVSRFETRQGEFAAIMGYNPSVTRGAMHPVENITGREAMEFCAKLTEAEREKGRLPLGHVYDLPTYTQWMEYSADAGLSNSITPVSGRRFGSSQPVGSGEINRLGLYDIRGNVAEYSKDKYVSTGSHMILGAWWNEHRSDFLKVSNKAGFMNDDEKGAHVGFRCVLVPIVKAGE